MLTIRKFAPEAYQGDDLGRFGTWSPKAAAFLERASRPHNILVSGGTGAGKTTTLNVLSSFIPHDERIVTIEDAAELQLHSRTSSASSTGRPTSRAGARSPSATSSATPCACAPTASSSVRSVVAKRSTCSRR
jgi:Flp pilus assembly CpaF family ATPase